MLILAFGYLCLGQHYGWFPAWMNEYFIAFERFDTHGGMGILLFI